MAGGAAWFLIAQTRWFATKLHSSLLRAGALALGSTLAASACLLAIAIPVALL